MSSEFQEASEISKPRCLSCGTKTQARLPNTRATFYLCNDCGGQKPVLLPSKEEVDA